ncbi:DUF484 family protein [Alkalimarinus alittae]|uniref:DUF484 family protein n=1 Tax=Alkalimarinus alittae TaxID=2961619 RepID=A0ABY6N2X2_9ALTE|nr:DUF484 family protein [Alkalimarinus alittae]UZE96461.1 DUF484 family protein [Alkalimarinus alittae]
MTDNVVTSENQQTLTEQQVVEYLRTHSAFFIDNEYLLKEIKLPHQSGKAISLAERQVHLFREQRDDLQRELADLIEIAKQNDQFFDKSKRLLMNLLEAQSLDEVMIVVQESVQNDFGLAFCSMLLFGDRDEYPVSNVQMISQIEAESVLGTLIESRRAVCGRFTDDQLQCLFPEASDDVASAAVIPLRGTDVLGMFSLGSKGQDYFESGMGSLFLTYISDTLSRLLPPLLQSEKMGSKAESVASLLD